MYLRSLRFRLTTVFAAVFIIGAAALYAVSYLLISSSLRSEEASLLRSKLLEFWAVYQTGRAAAVQQELTLEKIVSESTAFLVRVADRDNQTLVLFHPSGWRSYGLDSLSEVFPSEDHPFVRLRTGRDTAVLTLAVIRLFDGNILQVGVSNAQRFELLKKLRRVYLFVAIPLVVVGIAGGWLVSSRALSPVKKLSTLSRFIIETGELSERIPPTGSKDELDELTTLFNSMLGKIESLVTAMRRSLDNVAHDLRTPMTRLRMRAEDSMRQSDSPDEIREVLGAIVTETEQMLTMLNTLMDISEAEVGVMKLDLAVVDIGDLVHDIAELYSYTATDRGVDLNVEAQGGARARIDVNRLRQVIANLLDNAIKYSNTGGEVRVVVEAREADVMIQVIDSGVGIAAGDLPHIWERLYRADRSRSKPGLGLGLGLVKAIIEAHRGTVSVSSEIDKGSTFTVTLPAVKQESTV
jgi:signal transduction histidine kinase